MRLGRKDSREKEKMHANRGRKRENYAGNGACSSECNLMHRIVNSLSICTNKRMLRNCMLRCSVNLWSAMGVSYGIFIFTEAKNMK